MFPISAPKRYRDLITDLVYIDNRQAGSAQSTTPSASALYVTLVPVLLYACLFFGIFLLVRSLYPRIYAPRTFIDGLTPQYVS